LRGDDLTDGIAHEHHDLRDVSMGERGWGEEQERTPTVAFLVKPPMLEDIRLRHMM